MTRIVGPILDSAGVPANGQIEFRQVQRFATSEGLITTVVATAIVTNGQLSSTAVERPFEVPASPEGTYAELKEFLGGKPHTWNTTIPDQGEISYKDLDELDPAVAPGMGPSYLNQTEGIRDDMLALLTQLPDDAAVAISNVIAALDILLRGEPGTPRIVTDLPGILISLVDKDGYQTFMTAESTDGGPNSAASNLIFARMTFARFPSQTVIDLAKGIEQHLNIFTDVPKMDGVLLPFVSDPDSSAPYLLWPTVADDGGPLPFWVNDFKNRLTQYVDWVSESMLTPAFAAKLSHVTGNIYTAELDGGALYTQERSSGDRRLITNSGTPSDPQITVDGWVVFDTTGGKMARKADGTGIVVPYQTAMTYYMAWGDSLTANYTDIGADQPNTYSAILSGLLGLGTTEDTDYYNGGRGSEHIEQIAARQGGIELRNVGTVNVPTTTTAVAVTLDKTINSYIPQGFNFLCTFGGIPGTLARASAATNYTFTRTTAGSLTPVASGTLFVPAIDTHAGEIQSFAGLMNDIVHDTDVATNSATILTRGLNAVQAMADHLPAYNKRYLVIGTLTRSNWLLGSTEHDLVLAYHAGLLAAHGDKFVDVRSMIIENAADIAAAESITLTGPDTTPGTDLYNLAHDTMPPSFMYDATHYFGWVEAYIADWMFQRAQEKGWA